MKSPKSKSAEKNSAAKPKAKGAARASTPRKRATASKPKSPKAGAKAKADASEAKSASQLIDRRIRDLAGWRGETLARVRALIFEADPEVTEEVKWRKPSSPAGVPVWSHDGIICTGETYKDKLKLTFAQGAKLPDTTGLFNSSLDGGTRRAIDIREGEQVDARAFKALVKAAVAQNGAPAKKAKKTATTTTAKRSARASAKHAKPDAGEVKPVKLLSGGNPQIAKGHGDAPVQTYIAAMPGWKRDVGRRLDAIIARSVPKVHKAVKWNSPLYGFEGQGWFLGIHCFAKYVKVAFFRGASLRPVPPGKSKQKEVRYLDIREEDKLDEKQFAAWVKQASKLPGERM